MIEPGEINRPAVVAEVSAVFERYEAALKRNDLAELDAAFWDHRLALRYGVAEHSLGMAATRKARQVMAPVSPLRQLQGTVITTFGEDTACVSTEFLDPGSNLLGRQTQTWVRFAEGWRIVAAHVSLVDPARLSLFN